MTHVQSLERATHVYVGRFQPCGCIVAVVVDESGTPFSKSTASALSEFAKDGYVIERMTLEQWRTHCEEHGIGCKHNEKKQAEEVGLFGAPQWKEGE